VTDTILNLFILFIAVAFFFGFAWHDYD